MKIAVLGAGVVGATSAWFLAQDGHEVVVLDRQDGPGKETSFANGGQVSASQPEPWANPDTPRWLLEWLGRDDAPLRVQVRADPRQWLWCLAFLRECLPHRFLDNVRQLLALGSYSRAVLQSLRAETGIEYDHLERGILRFFTDAKHFDAALRSAERIRDLGAAVEVRTAQECVAIEPALAHIQPRLAGGFYARSDESGDAHRFTVKVAGLCLRHGTRLLYSRRIDTLLREGGRITAVRVWDATGRPEILHADAFVVALGSYSPLLLRPLDIFIPVYPAKGYSVTLPVDTSHIAPHVSLTDDGHKLVFSRLGDRLRIAGTAELAGYDASVTRARCEAILQRTFEVFPHAGDRGGAQFWAGLRPATPSNVPIIGKTRYPNLYLNTGHGTLGWTLACGSAKALADIVAGREPEVAFRFMGLPQAKGLGNRNFAQAS
jgi:D-amino-acid dehydrogenase